ncbi:uncharacterized protein LOC575172 [Strongylocentrotus purpuratus]|uniref:Uncharacterized protein n=1 Tax=Strongylocentrotus purpuratus TaxID=7668 RepID=A0A7M7P9K7_STRPU|nr:uncharacterized protein LOC575172 [Strongylocentrotus purpuratus]
MIFNYQFFLPAGILGVCSKKKNNCVIVAYLVMSILAAILAAFLCVMEIFTAVQSVDVVCQNYFPDYRNDGEAGAFYHTCYPVRLKGLTAIRSLIAILMFAEFVVAIVACVVCYGGLNGCCARPPTQQTNDNRMAFYPQSGIQPIQAQMGAHVVQGSELPAKA